MIINADCLEEMRKMDDCSISAIVTDPPYGLSFMGKEWDHGIPGIPFWREALRIAKPGSHLLAFGGTRTFHRLTCAIEDAGWQIRDCLMWLYSQGFPKSHNFGCKCTGEPVPYSHENAKSSSESCLRSLPKTHLSPQINPIDKQGEVLFSSMQEQGSQIYRPLSIERDEARKEPCLERRCHIQKKQGELHRPEVCEMSDGIYGNGQERRICDGTSPSYGQTSESDSAENGSCSSQGSQHQKQQYRKSRIISRQQNSQNSGMATCEKCGGLKEYKGYGTALKPAWEPIIMAMKPCEGTFKQNAEKWGQAGINIDECRINTNGEKCGGSGKKSKGIWDLHSGSEYQGFPNITPDNGRWPANLILDEEAVQILDEQSGINASRFFYCAKASSSERNERLENIEPVKCGTGALRDNGRGKIASNFHPTVKPLKLMEYLIKLVMPPKNGILLDPFAGSGTTILAAKRLGFEAIGIEKDADYAGIAKFRVESFSKNDMIVGNQQFEFFAQVG